ncbi:MAG: hypothetical protein K0S61_2980 [Anaerocolumna sp.]|jgi:hypothetical protein|nr:hypothetical protein [Anaerocolumna sp.]
MKKSMKITIMDYLPYKLTNLINFTISHYLDKFNPKIPLDIS